MNGYKLEILGKVPSKKNNKKFFIVKRKTTGKYMPIFFPSSMHESWHKSAINQMLGKTCFEEITKIELIIYAPDRRKSDLTNKAESVMDLLVDCGIIPDDNWFDVPEVNLKFGGVDVKNPRAEIIIYGKEKLQS